MEREEKKGGGRGFGRRGALIVAIGCEHKLAHGTGDGRSEGLPPSGALLIRGLVAVGRISV